MIRVTRRYRFAASHRLHTDALSETANRELYGKCNNPHGHGHDYVLDVTIKGPSNRETGLTVIRATLDELVADAVLRDLDHRNLNADVREFLDAVPTSENVTAAIESRLRSAWKSTFPGEWPRLDAVKLQETKRNSFEWRA